MLAFPLTLLMALPFALAAPRCSVKTTSAATSAPTGSSSSSSPNITTSNTGGSNGTIAMSWFANWRTDFTVSNISWDKYTAVSWFATNPGNDPSTLDLANGLEEFVTAAHSNALMTVGGWDGSMYFSSLVGSSDNRTTFVNTIRDIAFSNGLDGIDIDWEYPGKPGLECNIVSPNDSANLLSFLQALRAATPNITLSAAVAVTPFADSTGQPMTDVSQFADVLDYIEIMNYDVWGSFSSTVGPNAPLNDTCASAGQQAGSAVSAVAAWTKAGFPSNKIILGVPAYGHSYFVSNANATGSSSTDATTGSLIAYPGFNAAQQPAGDAWNDVSGTDPCGNPQGPTGVYDFWGMIADGFLNEDGSVASGMASRYDSCSQTPYVYNPQSQIMISYDNATSFAAKGEFVVSNNLAGFAMYETGGDYNNILIDAINSAVGRS
ncbi:glycoside hydrolase family 18 protein [Hygrophoropsis aurantiaca]|uniref:Glycoside hydrolase family 18 protein n=1 Tax=Hygrophoropsis aurantiaca TaxID=72124 RepID=A0ACB8AB57_9AGAM|nr:glycoside hydrolase family 18 protein [Hygrophoropsis aurantiaca]